MAHWLGNLAEDKDHERCAAIIAAIVHEVNQPLAAISSFASAINYAVKNKAWRKRVGSANASARPDEMPLPAGAYRAGWTNSR